MTKEDVRKALEEQLPNATTYELDAIMEEHPCHNCELLHATPEEIAAAGVKPCDHPWQGRIWSPCTDETRCPDCNNCEVGGVWRLIKLPPLKPKVKWVDHKPTKEDLEYKQLLDEANKEIEKMLSICIVVGLVVSISTMYLILLVLQLLTAV